MSGNEYKFREVTVGDLKERALQVTHLELLCSEQDYHLRQRHILKMTKYAEIVLTLNKLLFLNASNVFFKQTTGKDRGNIDKISFGDVENVSVVALRAGKISLAHSCFSLIVNVW